LHSAAPHLNHFCSVIPNTSPFPYTPIYDINPPELPEGWHSFQSRLSPPMPPPGPFGSTVTLPRVLPPHLQVFTVEKMYKTKTSAHQHVAFQAYLSLYHNGLLSDHLLPLTDEMQTPLDDEVKALLKDIDKRAAMAGVSCQIDPWSPVGESNVWQSSELAIDGFPVLVMFTLSRPMTLLKQDGPTLYRPDGDPLKVEWRIREDLIPSEHDIEQAQRYTRRLFWSLHGSYMKWENMDFTHLFLPTTDIDRLQWDARRAWLTERNAQSELPNADPLIANAAAFGVDFGFPTDLTLISRGPSWAKTARFLRWEFNPVSPDAEEQLRKIHSRTPDLEITYPLLAAVAVSKRRNFLTPLPPRSLPPKEILLLPQLP